MAIKSVKGNLMWGPRGDATAGPGGLSDVIATSTQKSYSSESEVVGSDGELVDIIYTGGENVITETTYSSTFSHQDVGSGDYTNGLTTKVRIEYTNEDASKVTVEKLQENTEAP